MLMLPEIIIIVFGFIVLTTDLLDFKNFKNILGPMTFMALVFSLISLIWGPQTGVVFEGRFVMDPLAWWFKLIFILAGLLTVGISIDVLSENVKETNFKISSAGEFCAILLFTISGMMFLVSSRDLISLYVSLELATIPLFLLVSWRKKEVESEEAGLKYLVSGALASGFILLGMSFLYGLTGVIELSLISEKLNFNSGVVLAFILIFSGAGFKVALVPFHMWAGDVYQGAPTSITAFLSVASKSAGVALLLQIVFNVFSQHLDRLQWLIIFVSVITMTLGNLVAIAQSNMKRFMAFSSISQAGYILMGFLDKDLGVSAIVYYLLIYMFTNLALFAVVIYHSQETGAENIEDYKGLSKTQPLLALVMLLALFSLAGIPPLSGFLGKFFLFGVAAKKGLYWLVALGAVNSTISLYYYLKIVRQMYIENPKKEVVSQPLSFLTRISIVGATFALVVLGIIPHVYEMMKAQL